MSKLGSREKYSNYVIRDLFVGVSFPWFVNRKPDCFCEQSVKQSVEF